MADNNNPGQFGNRNDTEEQARKGGEQSPGQFGASEGADPSRAGQQGGQQNQNQGGQQSQGQFGTSEGADPAEAGRKGAQAQSNEDKAKGGRNS